jgi:hypothetical protein
MHCVILNGYMHLCNDEKGMSAIHSGALLGSVPWL